MAPRILYCHGFGSGPSSSKARAFERHLTERGHSIDRLNLRVPSLEHLRLSAMIETAGAAIGTPHDRAIVIGSSLGGLTAARLAERDPRVMALVLMAPAFRIMKRWREQLGPVWDEWQRTGWRAITDYTTNTPAQIDFGFAEDVMTIDHDVPEIRIPTLIVHGIHDESVPVDHSREFARGKDNVTLVEVDDDHGLDKSTPRILELATEFLAPWLRRAS